MKEFRGLMGRQASIGQRGKEKRKAHGAERKARN